MIKYDEKTFFKANIKEHLIFNSLNCAVSLCRKDPKLASEFLIAFSDCLRYTSQDSEDLVLIEEELEFISSYIYIQSIRFNKKIEVNYEFDRDIKNTIKRFSMHEYISKILAKLLKNNDERINIKILNEDSNKISMEIFSDDNMEFKKIFLK